MADDYKNPKLLAHFTTASLALEHILPRGQIRFSPLREAREPREVKVRNLRVSDENVPSRELRRIRSTFEEVLLDQFHLFSCTDYADDRYSYERLGMWERYADMHRGVCLLFDEEELHSQIAAATGSVFRGRVRYDDIMRQRPTPGARFVRYPEFKSNTPIVAQRHIETFYDIFFFLKDRDWEGENEYRWVVPRPHTTPLHVAYGESLKYVIMGADCPRENLPRLVSLCGEEKLLTASWYTTSDQLSLHRSYLLLRALGVDLPEEDDP